MKYITFLILCCLSLQVLVAQSPKHLYFQSKRYGLGSNNDWKYTWKNTDAFDGKKYFLIQFNEIPTNAQKR